MRPRTLTSTSRRWSAAALAVACIAAGCGNSSPVDSAATPSVQPDAPADAARTEPGVSNVLIRYCTA